MKIWALNYPTLHASAHYCKIDQTKVHFSTYIFFGSHPAPLGKTPKPGMVDKACRSYQLKNESVLLWFSFLCSEMKRRQIWQHLRRRFLCFSERLHWFTIWLVYFGAFPTLRAHISGPFSSMWAASNLLYALFSQKEKSTANRLYVPDYNSPEVLTSLSYLNRQQALINEAARFLIALFM